MVSVIRCPYPRPVARINSPRLHRYASPAKVVPMFRGNKQYLPSKPCAACGRTMTWRKAWARNWESVRYCSDRCRRSPRTPVSRA